MASPAENPVRTAALIVAGLAWLAAYGLVLSDVRSALREDGRPSLSAWVLYGVLPAPVVLLALEGYIPLRTSGLLLGVVGCVLSILGLVLVRGAHRELVRWRTTARERPAELGPYAAVRHPQALGFGACLLGFAAAGLSWAAIIAALVYWPVFRLAVSREERRARERFGEHYDAYTARVGIWKPRRIASDGPERPSASGAA